jgi:hypothetical protein
MSDRVSLFLLKSDERARRTRAATLAHAFTYEAEAFGETEKETGDRLPATAAFAKAQMKTRIVDVRELARASALMPVDGQRLRFARKSHPRSLVDHVF